MNKSILTQQELKEKLHYNPDTGVFTWINPDQRNIWIKLRNGIAGSLSGSGYTYIEINHKSYRASRLAWLYMTGKFPENMVDHINGIKTDDRWCNLRDATNSQNQQNQREAAKHGKSGYLGVSYYSTINKYVALITINKKKHSLGYFDNPEDASKKYLEAKRKLHEFCTI